MFYRREWKTPELTISQMTSIYRARIKGNNLHTSRIDLQLKTKRRNHNEMGRRGRHTVRTHFPRGRLTNRRIITVAEVLPQEGGVSTPHQAPQPWGVLHWEDWPPEPLTLQTSRACKQKWRAVGNKAWC